MDFSTIPLFEMMKIKLEYLSQRQATLAQNIANADTPKYKAKDVAAPDFKQFLTTSGNGAAQKLPLKLPMAVTNASHLTNRASSANEPKLIKQKLTDELNPNGNNVVIEEEIAKVAQNQQEYTKTINLYSKAISMFKTAIGNPNTGA